MIVSNLISSIKFEGKANATTEYDSWLLDVLNEEYLLLTEKRNHQQFKTTAILSFMSGNPSIPLPSDFLRLIDGSRLKFYSFANSQTYRNLVPTTELYSKKVVGNPIYYEIKGDSIYVYPYSLVLDTDRIEIPYYTVPPILTTSSVILDKFAIQLKHRAITRLLVLRDSKAAAIHQQLAEDRFKHGR